MPKNKPHQKYFLKDGTQVPGVTTVLKVINLPALAPAANKLGLLGINSNILWRDLAEIGTIAHAMILSHLKNENFDTAPYRYNLIDRAENSFLSYLEWEKGHKIEPVLLETPLVSEFLRYGGTLDLLCHLDEQVWLTLIDFKTGGIYKEAYWQIAGYAQLLTEHDYTPVDAVILGIPRTVDEHFNEQLITEPSLGLYPFIKALDLYNAMRNYDNQVKESANVDIRH